MSSNVFFVHYCFFILSVLSLSSICVTLIPLMGMKMKLILI
ncbi:hypothetical protein PROVRETT_09525 [Providencia rettgeri DSM 1131]|nr:hypothetical protein PROVRETT_09525 [Providencia rettgeri DSM 1131]